ncbi:MAG: tetraacyldisaccharide 4'-kinase, partial [Pseudomonadota bacterium]
IGRPQKFFDGLKQAGMVVEQAISFPDHHPFHPREIERLKREARRNNALLVTTMKDYMRLSANERQGILPIPATLHLENASKLDTLLRPLIDRS